MTLGAHLIAAAEAARQRVTLVAPFIKVDALRTVLEHVSDSAVLNVVARWIPAEIAVGVCDLEIFDVISVRPNAKLFVHPMLHAKLYRFDEVILFGSANMTGKALGWKAPANVELLHAPKELKEELLAFESELLNSAIQVDAAPRSILALLAGGDVGGLTGVAVVLFSGPLSPRSNHRDFSPRTDHWLNYARCLTNSAI